MIDIKHVPRDGVRWARATWSEAIIRHRPIKCGQRHKLPGPLIVSLTSYPARFRNLDITLRTLLSQDVRADAVVLWVGYGLAKMLSPEVHALVRHGLVIRECNDTQARSLTKIVPAFFAYPGAYIVIADDDMVYPVTWLASLVNEYRSPDEALCRVALRFTVGADGLPIPYLQWPRAEPGERGQHVYPIGSSGVLYPPGFLPPETADVGQFASLTPEADDVWLYWMFAQNGKPARRIRSYGRIARRRNSQAVGLHHRNDAGGGNDRQIAAMVEAYGLPSSGAGRMA